MPLARFALRGLAALGLLTACLLLLQRTDRHRDMGAGQRLYEMEQVGDRLTFVAVGSSRTKFHLMPDVLDSTMAALGVPVYSFNYGLLGTPASEISYAVDQVLQADLPQLRTIAVELQPLPLRELHWHPLSRKGAYHFDARRVGLGLRAAHVSDLSGAEKRAAYGRFLRLGLRHYLVAGQGTNLLRSWLDRDPTFRLTQSERGFTPLSREAPASEEQMSRVYSRYLALLDSLSGQADVVPTAVDSVITDHFLDLEQRAADRGVALLFVIQPMTTGVDGVAHLLERHGRKIVHLNDPSDYPELYNVSLWYDGSHLNSAGARALSQTAAREMAAEMRRAR